MNASTDKPDRASLSRRSMLAALVTLPLLLTALALIVSLAPPRTLGQEGTPAAAPCLVASPGAATGTPPSVATPALVGGDGAAPPTLGTPVTASCLTVILTAESTRAGPGTLTVDVRDAGGAPVSDADVVINTRHIGMDHGTSISETVASGPGTYVAERVSLGMGGAWEVQIVIARSGFEDVVVIFVIDLMGPE